MLTQEQNERLTRVGPGTPMGELMRRYWHPVSAGVDVSEENPTKEVPKPGETAPHQDVVPHEPDVVGVLV